jgi:hypothetical protein
VKLYVKVSRVTAYQEAAPDEQNQTPYTMDSFLFEVFVKVENGMMTVGRLYFSPEQMELINPQKVIAELLEGEIQNVGG